MNIITWNCKGTNSKGFSSLIKDLSKEYDYALFFLLKMHATSV